MHARLRSLLTGLLVLALAAAFAYTLPTGLPVTAAPSAGVTNLDSLTLDSDLTVSDDATITDNLTVSGLMDLEPNEENIGVMSILSTTVTYQSSGALWTIGAGELWFIHGVLIEVTTDFDCTGDDCTVSIGDGNDTDGLLALVDAELQAADTELTGGSAGWQGQLAGTLGAYLADGMFVYEEATAETIDITVGGTSPAAGAARVWLLYTRVY